MSKKILSKPGTKPRLVVKPIIFNLGVKKELDEFQHLIKTNPSIQVCNQIESQLKELMKINNPKLKLSDDEALILAEKHVGYKNFMNYGVWVHYPWNNNLVHLLPQDEFIKTRTSRNNYKITPEEQQLLLTKSVGVIGLSVGQSISLTMAMERVFGEIRIADFDELELTNLNRIRAGVHQLGLPKVALVAREIAEIDPFLKVTCFWDGISETNIDQFLLEGGKLDLVADECDTIHLKFYARQRCKALKIPVLMDTSDRGMLDVERFDLEPDRPIFHGLVDHLDISKSKNLKTNEEKVAYALPIIGIDQASTRIKASMLEIEQSITTWPQLSSDVALGGAISTNVIRRIFLNQHQESGRFYVDTDEIIPDSLAKTTAVIEEKRPDSLSLESMLELAEKVELNNDKVQVHPMHEEDILESALHAPSGGNCQPWKWLIHNGAYFLFHDKHYSQSFLDYNNLASYMAHGCAVENFTITAQSHGYHVKLSEFPLGENGPLTAVIELTDKPQNVEPQNMISLASYVTKRLTNRNHSFNQAIPNSELDYLKSTAELIKGASLSVITDSDAISELSELLAAVDKIRISHQESHQELFKNEIRYTEEENLKTRDGVDLELLNLSSSDEVGLNILSNYNVVKKLKEWDLGNGLGEMSKKQILDSAAVGLISIKGDDNTKYLQGGRSVEKVWIAATKLNIAFQPMSVITYYLKRLKDGGQGFSEKDKSVLSKVQLRFDQIFSCQPQESLIFLFRLAKADTPKKLSLRRKKNELVYKK